MMSREGKALLAGELLAGDRMRLDTNTDGTTTLTFDDRGTGRVCGSCTLCCRLLPVPSIDKAAGQRCQHARFGKGCTIYASRPDACRTWWCRWLSDPGTAGMPRPDRCHYVIDQQEDVVRATHGEDVLELAVLQVWIDPDHRDAHRAPELRGYLARMAELHRLAAILRFSSDEAVVLIPPAMSIDKAWHEIGPKIISRNALERKILQDHNARTRGKSNDATRDKGLRI